MKQKDNMCSDLRITIELDKEYKEKVKNDADFKEYWDDPDFKKLTE